MHELRKLIVMASPPPVFSPLLSPSINPGRRKLHCKGKETFVGGQVTGEGSRLSPAPVALGLIFCKQTHIQMYSAQAQQGQPGAAAS